MKFIFSWDIRAVEQQNIKMNENKTIVFSISSRWMKKEVSD